MLPSGNVNVRGEIACGQPGYNQQNTHNQPGIEDRHVQRDKTPTPEDYLIGTNLINAYYFHI
jgi:hypothetical protein